MISRRFFLGVLAFSGGLACQSSVWARSSRPVSFAAIDTDGNGTLELDEVKRAATALFDEFDADHSGTLTRRELSGRVSASELAKISSKPGAVLTKDEFLSLVETRFKAADADHDGTLSDKEFKSKAGLALRRLLH